ncbi:SPOR domain-containing protein [Neisseria sp. Ec49-e6-T10]|uniref:SPOR domain-containing protein n=1 Tax=Neisseria sp. Ec49-e6-T10 TaxID=3140744 RepID=UPI003EBE4388
MANNSTNDYEQLKRRNRRRLVGTVVLVFIAIIILWKAISYTPEQKTQTDFVVINDQVSDTVPQTYPQISSDPIAQFASEPIVEDPAIASIPTEPEIISEPTIASNTEHNTQTQQPPAAISTPPTSPEKQTTTTAQKKPVEKKPVEKKPTVTTPPKVNSKPDPKDILEGRVTFKENSTTAANSAHTGKVVIQVAALSDSAQAAQMKSKLADIGISANISKANTSKGEINRVRVGPFSNREEAEKTLNRLKASGMNGIIVSQ